MIRTPNANRKLVFLIGQQQAHGRIEALLHHVG